jgi:hypothetical protein
VLKKVNTHHEGHEEHEEKQRKLWISPVSFQNAFVNGACPAMNEVHFGGALCG